VAKLSGLAAGGFAAILGVLTDAVDIEVRADSGADESGERIYSTGDGIQLPRPGTAESTMHVSDAIADRRSRREYGTAPVTLAELGQLLWATQGITERQVGRVDLRAAPSAGATYPLDVFAVPDTPGVEGLEPGVYQYRPDSHELGRLRTGAFGAELQDIAIDQEWVGGAALNIVITAVDERTTERYGLRGRRRYVPMEAGHAGQNLYLQAEALELSTVAIGAFRDEDLLGLLGVGEEHRPLYIYPVGRRR
jgi:SagB-type dehydrogenase family enzyme